MHIVATSWLLQGRSQKLLAEVLLCPGSGEGLMTPFALVSGPGCGLCNLVPVRGGVGL